jgi:hypothetical protein
VPLHHAPGDQRAAAVDLAAGQGALQLKTPWRNGTTHVEFEPVEFIAKLAALVPPPRAHLTRFHGIFRPEREPARRSSPPRIAAKAASGRCRPVSAHDDRTPDEKRRAMSWAQRLKRVFGIDVTTCAHCGGAVKIVASVEDPPPSAPSSTTSRSTARWSRRTTGPQRARRRRRRDAPTATPT